MDNTAIQQLVTDCRNNGMKLWTEDGKIKYKANEEFLKTGILMKLKANKIQLIKYLEDEKKESLVVTDEKGKYEPFLLTDVQSAYVLGRSNNFSYGDVACHNYMEFVYDKLDPVRVEDIFKLLIKRHDMLRAVIYEDGYQQILKDVPDFEIQILDENATDEDIEALRNEKSHKVYELGKAPMFSIALTQRQDKSILHFSIEFLIADWTSVWMILSEFEKLYFEPETELENIGISFRDYLLTEKKYLKGSKAINDKNYWLSKLENFPLSPKIPILNEDKAVNRFIRKTLVIENAKWDRLKDKSNREGITPTALVMTAYGEVLRKWSMQKDFALNMTVLNRKLFHEDIFKVVGDFTTLALIEMRKGSENDTFLDRARATNKNIFESLDHSDYSGVEMIRELSKKYGRDQAMMPYVFTSAIGLIDNDLRGKFEGIGISQTPQVFIDCQAMDTSEGLRINWDIRKGVFEENLVENMFAAFEHLLDDADNLPLTDLKVEIPEKQQLLWQHFNETQKKLPGGLLYTDFLEQAKRSPDRIAVTDESVEFTYGQLYQQSMAVAENLIDAGITPGECVAVLMGKSAYQAVAALGILFAAGVYVPVDGRTDSHGRRDKIIKQANIRFVVTEKIYDDLPEGIVNILAPECTYLGKQDIRPVKDTDAAYVIFTSGTTGEPKGVVISHGGALNTIQDINSSYQVTADDAVLGLSEFNFDLSVYDLFGMLSVGGRIYYPQDLGHMNPEQWEKLIIEKNITVWNSVPALMQMYLSHRKLNNISRPFPIRLVLLSGDWIPVDLPGKIKEYSSDVQVVCMGGATEASIWSNYHIALDEDINRNSIPYGVPLSNQRFYVLDSEYQLCPVGVPGQLFIGGSGVALGYLNDKELTEKKFVKEYLRDGIMYATGDMGRMLENGELEFLGRIDDQVKVRGYRIELGEIEHAFLEVPFISNAVARIDKNKSDLPIQVVSSIEKDTNEKIVAKEKELKNVLNQVELDVTDELNRIADFDYKHQKELQNKATYLSIIYACNALNIQSLSDIEVSDIVKSEYKWVLKHWIKELERANLIDKLGTANVTLDEVNEAWETAKANWKDAYGSIEVLNYYKNSALELVEVCKGKVDPIGILYPNGEDIYTKALYVDGIAARGMTKSIIAIVQDICKKKCGNKVRILEIGAGTAATAEPVLKSIGNENIEYHFTDISKYFFKAAREKFADLDKVQIYEFDLNKSLEDQGMSENYFDVIIAAYVLNNVKDIRNSLLNMEKMAAPNGIIMFSEALSTEIPLLICQAFLMTKAEDELRNDTTFIDSKKWLSLLEDTNYSGMCHIIPCQDGLMKDVGAGLYIKQAKSGYMSLDRDEVMNSLRMQLTEYMIPQAVEYTLELPLTANKKVDRKKVFEGRFVSKKIVTEENELTDLEKSLKKIWEGILQIQDLGRTSNLYDFGADSLVMAQSVTKMKNELNIDISFDVLLRRLLNYPTIKDLAEFIEQEKAPRVSQQTNDIEEFYIVKEHGGRKEDGLRVLIHGALGTDECFQKLIPHLVKQDCGQVISFSIVNNEKYLAMPSDNLINELADTYTKAIMDRKPSKIQIIGYSFSGSIAIEIARRLSENDIDVASLVVIDGGTLPVTVSEDMVYEWLFIDSMKIGLKDLGFITDNMLEKAFLNMSQKGKKQLEINDFKEIIDSEDNELFAELSDMSVSDRMAIYCKVMDEKQLVNFSPNMLNTYFEGFKHSFAALTFLPDLYFGDIRYLSSRDKQGAYSHFNLLLEQWLDICIGEFDSYEIPGDHYSCVEDKNNARALSGYLWWDKVVEAGAEECSLSELEMKFTREQLQQAYDVSEKMVCYVMLNHLQEKGALLSEKEETAQEIIEKTGANPKGAVVLTRWLRELESRDYIKTSNGKYVANMIITNAMTQDMIRQRSKLWDGVIGDRKSGEYLENNIHKLDGLIKGTESANFILFPEGKLDYATALYKSMIIFRYLNQAVATTIVESGAQGKRILEVGAGTGSTSDVILDWLEKENQIPEEYLYTDISRFFLNKAMERYANIPFMRYKTINLDEEISEEKVDYIVANGVLNNMVNLKKTLTNLKNLLKENGQLFIVEPARESLEILISQAFMMSDTEDVRNEQNQTFMNDSQWKEILEDAGFELRAVYPNDDSPLEVLGQKLYVAVRRQNNR